MIIDTMTVGEQDWYDAMDAGLIGFDEDELDLFELRVDKWGDVIEVGIPYNEDPMNTWVEVCVCLTPPVLPQLETPRRLDPLPSVVDLENQGDHVWAQWYDYNRSDYAHFSNFRDSYCLTPPCVQHYDTVR